MGDTSRVADWRKDGKIQFIHESMIDYRSITDRWPQRVAMSELHWCRIVMNRAIDQLIEALDCAALDCLEISGQRFAPPRYGFRRYRTTAYPAYDVCAGALADEQFDLIVCEQVLEHVVCPDRAVANMHRMLRPGGLIMVNTPFLLKVHGFPFDFWRWTEEGLRLLLQSGGFTNVKTGSWGNRACLIADLTDGLQWTMYDPAVHSLVNEPQFPIVVWATAQKSA
jgi:SAM-dependent methyltransferase